MDDDIKITTRHPLWIIRTVIPRFLHRLRHAFRLKEIYTWPYESCQRCGATYRVAGDWNDDMWKVVVGSKSGLLCPSCFAQMAVDASVVLKDSDVTLWWFRPEGRRQRYDETAEIPPMTVKRSMADWRLL